MKKPNYFFLFVTIVLAIIIILGLSELKKIFVSFSSAIWYFLLLAGFFQILFFIFQSEVRRSLYRILEIKEKFWNMLKMTFAAMFLATAIPSFHMAGLAMFMKEAKVKKYSQSRALLGSLTFLFFDFMGFFLTLVLAVSLLLIGGKLIEYQLVSTIILFLIIVGASAGALYVLKEKSRVRWMFEKISKLIPKKKREKWLPQKEIDMIAKESTEAKKYFTHRKFRLWQPTLFAFLTQIAGILTLMSVFLAYGLPFTIVSLIVVYSMAILFQIVAVTPYGVGSAEIAITLTLAGFGIAIGNAVLITLTFRFFNFWIPTLVGYISTKDVAK